MTKSNGGPVFPLESRTGISHGITLRDYFAAKAMQGTVSADQNDQLTFEQVAKRAYIFADEMLKEREA